LSRYGQRRGVVAATAQGLSNRYQARSAELDGITTLVGTLSAAVANLSE
jgi:hypothetical protein